MVIDAAEGTVEALCMGIVVYCCSRRHFNLNIDPHPFIFVLRHSANFLNYFVARISFSYNVEYVSVAVVSSVCCLL